MIPQAANTLAGQTALITGATGGIGSAVARDLKGAGARVGLVARHEDRLRALARELDGWSFPADVTDPEALAGMAEDFTTLAGGPPDILVTSAGVFSLQPVEEISSNDLRRSLAVNLRGNLLTVRACLSGMKERGTGTIIQLGSVAGRKGFRDNGAYAAAKFGLRGFHEVLLEELRGTGIRATLLEPSATDTPLWDDIDPDNAPELPDRRSMLSPGAVSACVLFVAERDVGVQIPYMAVEAA